jgi:PilZ domain
VDCATARREISPPQNPRFPGHDRFTLTLHFARHGLSHAAKPGKVPSLSGDHSMLDRRQSARDKVIYGGVAEIDERGATRDCVVRNISENGASIEFSNVIKLPKKQISLTIARKGRSFLARIIWWRDNFVGVAFSSETSSGLPVSDLEERLRQSEAKKRQLQRRIKQLMGEG